MTLRRHALLAPLPLWLSCKLFHRAPKPLSPAQVSALYLAPLAPPTKPLAVFHLGHSLVGRNMPTMLSQLAGAGHGYESQLGWGATLKSHWGPAEQIPGFKTENNHPRYRDAKAALDSGSYDAFVLTEMVELRDAIKYHDSWDYLARWAKRAWQKNPNTRVYLYETWPKLDDPEGWLNRLDRDLGRYWEHEILDRALATADMVHPIYVIPAGQVFARFMRVVEAQHGVEGIQNKEALFARNDDGSQDPIHPSDLGAYLVALTHYAVLYQKSPIGLPRQLHRADGTLAAPPSPAAALLMQQVVWDVVTSYPRTGVTPPKP